jgi:hypothetical protein
VSTLIPEYLGNYQSELGDEVASRNLLGSSKDPYRQYGERVAEYIMGTINEVPVEWRKVALQAVLAELDPGLPERVTARANKYKRTHKHWDAKTALRAAIATSVSDGLAKEIVKIGQTGMMPSMKSLAGLGTYDDALETAYIGLGWSIGGAISAVGSGIKKGVTTVTGGVKTAVTSTGSAIKSGATWVGSKTAAGAGAVWDGTKWVGGKVASGAKTAYSWGKTAVKAIHGLTCKVMKSPVSDVAAGAVAAYYGVPPQVGVAGHKMTTGVLCGKDGKPLSPEELSELEQNGGLLPKKKFPTLLVVGGGAAALGVLYLATRKS